MDFPDGAEVKNPPASTGDARMQVRSLGQADSLEWEISLVGKLKPLQYSCLKDSMDRGAWWATVHGATKSQT